MAKIPFKISARAASLIGQENIATADGAIIELIKNSYDADATESIIFFDEIKNKRVLYIIDDGHGMSDKIIQDHWMTIGTDNKLNEPKTIGKRIKTGAKGIGRFALDRLGTSATIITLPIGSRDGFEWKINWSEFQNNKTLDEVYADFFPITKLKLSEKLLNLSEKYISFKQYINKKAFVNGTIIKIENLKDEWDEKNIKALYKSFEILVPPADKNSFTLSLFCSYSKLPLGKVESLVSEDYDYKLVAKVQKNSDVVLTVTRKEFNWKDIHPDVFKQKSPRDMSIPPYNLETLKKGTFTIHNTLEEFWPGIDENAQKIIKGIGPFTFTFYYLKKSNKDSSKFAQRLVDTARRKEWLDQFAGIKLYRDGFRVRPYGEMNSNAYDWLDLGRRSAVSAEGPGQETGSRWKVEPQQVYGVINISRFENPNLKDTSNRAGLHENEYYYGLTEFLKRLINIIELDRHYLMRPMSVVWEKNHKIDENITKANKQAEVILHRSPKSSKSSKVTITKSQNSSDFVFAQAVKDLQKIISNKDSEIKMLRVLGSVGLTLGIFSHELDELNGDMQIYIDKLSGQINYGFDKKSYSNVERNSNPFLLITEIEELNLRMSDWLNFAKSSLKKDRRKATDQQLNKYFTDFEKRWSSFLELRKTTFIIKKKFGSLKIKNSYPIDLDSIFNNLLLNSIDAFFRKDSSNLREIYIDYEYEDNGINIIYEDTGPGLLATIKESKDIFLPFFTTKKKDDDEIGIGLGMWIVKNTIDQYNGYLEILNSRPNFKVKIHFPKISN